MQPRPEAVRDVCLVLRETRDLLERSVESDWSAVEPAEAAEILTAEMASLERSGEFRDRTRLLALFVPAAGIQEIALASDWSERYVSLAERFDAAVHRLPHRLTYHARHVRLLIPLVMISVVVAVAALDPRAEFELVPFGVALLLAAAAYVSSSLTAGRYTIAVSDEGLWFGAHSVPWRDVESVRVYCSRHPLIVIRERGRWPAVHGLLRTSGLLAAQDVDEASHFGLEPDVRGAMPRGLEEYLDWRDRCLQALGVRPADR